MLLALEYLLKFDFKCTPNLGACHLMETKFDFEIWEEYHYSNIER